MKYYKYEILENMKYNKKSEINKLFFYVTSLCERQRIHIICVYIVIIYTNI